MGQRKRKAGCDEKLRSRAATELGALDGIISYAERMIYREGRQHPYGSLRRHAYGKTVVVRTELHGEQEFRLSSTPAVITPNECGYATPLSPVGRLCSVVQLGDRGKSMLWGEWRVSEVRLLDRYEGAEFEPNVRNFLRMRVSGDQVEGEALDLAGWCRGDGRYERSQIDGKVQPRVSEDLHEAKDSEFAAIEVTENVQTLDEYEIDEDESEDAPEEISKDGYYGLNEVFYIDRTRPQDQVIARSPMGAMFVEGVAGSGKTSAALGRTKMLCDFDVANISSEAEFRDVMGEDGVYWGGQFAGQFSQESSVGFVRTGELIQYLKETCRRIDLPHLPVMEYQELQARLSNHRSLAEPRSGRRWTGAPQERTSDIETTMEWLRSADRSIAKLLASRFAQLVPSAEELSAGYEPKVQRRTQQILVVALSQVTDSLRSLGRELDTPGGTPSFLLDRLASRLQGIVRELQVRVLSKDTVWASAGGRTLVGATEGDIAQQLITSGLALFHRDGARMVWTHRGSLVDETTVILDQDGKQLYWNRETAEQLNRGAAYVHGADGKRYRGRTCEKDEFFLLLLPDTADRAYTASAGALAPVLVARGWGRVKLPMVKPVPDEDGLEQPVSKQNKQEQAVKHGSVQGVLIPLLRRRLLSPLQDIAELYTQSLRSPGNAYPHRSHAESIANQLENRQLTKADVDLVLCLMQIIGRGFKGAPYSLTDPEFYQSVFIDEVQDFTEQQVYLMSQQARSEYRAVTVVGDLAQKLHHGDSINVAACFPGQELSYVRLSENLRQAEAPGLALLSACFRAVVQEDGDVDPKVVDQALAAGGTLVRPLMKVCRDDSALDDRVLNEILGIKPHQTAAVIFPDEASAKLMYARLRDRLVQAMVPAEFSDRVDLSKRYVRHFTEVEKVKGLEFDTVLLPMLEAYDLDAKLQRNRLYVGITRARSRLVLLPRSRGLHPLLQRVVDEYQRLIGPPA